MKSLFSGIAKILAIIAIILLVIVAIMTGLGVALGTTLFTVFGFAITGTVLLIAGIGMLVLAYIIDPEAASEVVGRAFQMVEDIAEGAAEVVGGVASSLVSSVASNPLALALIGGAIWYFWPDDDGVAETTIQIEGSQL